MADFCSNCEPEYFDIDLTEIALDLDRGHSVNVLCEGCNIRTIYKDETGLLYLGRLENGEVVLTKANLESI